jgi:hypothetical protein
VEHWLFTQLARDGAASTLPVRGAAERALGSPGWVSTLLGPEGTGFVSGSSVAGRGRLPVDAGWRPWCCPYLENCTVDASIYTWSFLPCGVGGSSAYFVVISYVPSF